MWDICQIGNHCCHPLSSLPVWFPSKMDNTSAISDIVTGQTPVRPNVKVGHMLQYQGVVAGVPGHGGHLVQQQVIMVPDNLTVWIAVHLTSEVGRLVTLGVCDDHSFQSLDCWRI